MVRNVSTLTTPEEEIGVQVVIGSTTSLQGGVLGTMESLNRVVYSIAKQREAQAITFLFGWIFYSIQVAHQGKQEPVKYMGFYTIMDSP